MTEEKYVQSTKIVRCTCKSAYQDEHYGKNMRIYNKMKTENMGRCTVCGFTKNI